MGPRTRAIIAVDYGGHPCQVEEITKMARDRNMAVIEDAAHSLGASVGGRPVGSIADITAFSFYATKNITTGEGGMLTTQDGEIADRVERLRLHGIERDAWRRYRQGRELALRGGRGRVQGEYDAMSRPASGLSQLRREPATRARREAIAARYTEAFAALGNWWNCPQVKDGMRSAWHLYPIRLAGAARLGRDQADRGPRRALASAPACISSRST